MGGKRFDMQKLLITIIFSLGLGAGSVAAQSDHCFKNDGLKVQQTISYTLTGNKLEGTFDVSGHDPNASAEEFAFTGTKQGQVLTIKFKGKVPSVLAPGTHTIRWTLRKNSLTVPLYGKDYNKHRGYISYTATFQRCKEI
jgi:hypothetical protein